MFNDVSMQMKTPKSKGPTGLERAAVLSGKVAEERESRKRASTVSIAPRPKRRLLEDSFLEQGAEEVVDALADRFERSQRDLQNAREQIEALRSELAAEKAKVASLQKVSEHMRAENFRYNPAGMLCMTGLANYETLELIAEYYCGIGGGLTPRELAEREGVAEGPTGTRGRVPDLGPIDRVFVTYVWLRLALPFDALATLFGVGRTTISKTINSVLPHLARFYNETFPVPDKEKLVNTYPPEWFEALDGKFVALIIDSCEFFTEVSGNPLVQALTYSYYKHHCTGKFLVALTPDGYIAYISPVFGGRISDQELVKQSGFLDFLNERGMNIMADKGFTAIAMDLLGKGAYLLTPSRLGSRKQFTRSEAKINATISRLRIHVERAICLLKNFGILQKVLPDDHWHLVDDILATIRGTVCLMGPVTNRNGYF
jgi:hypothetical protein